MFDMSNIFGGIIGILFIIFFIILAILWVFIPFVLLEIRNVLYKILYELEKK